MAYLGRYIHKVAISNHRILGIDQQNVTFRWRDYRDNRQKVMKLEGTEFLRRFTQHILPKGFVRIRYYGFLSSSRKSDFRNIQVSLGCPAEPAVRKKRHWKEVCRTYLGYDPDCCPKCGKGKMIVQERFQPGRSPPLNMNKQ